MTIQVTPLQEEDIPGAVQAIQEAFKDDPYNNWVFDKENFNTSRNAASLALRCRWGMSQGIFHVARDDDSSSNKILGVACWLPPIPTTSNNNTTQESWWSWWSSSSSSSHFFASLSLTLGQILNNITYFGRGGLRLNRYYAWKRSQAQVQEKVWSTPSSSSPSSSYYYNGGGEEKGFYFLNIMVVIPGQQNKGVGRAMMEAVTKKADEEGIPCYLESSRDEPNVAIYGRFGFRCAAELVCRDEEDPAGDDGITLFAMVREPGAGPLSPEEARRMP